MESEHVGGDARLLHARLTLQLGNPGEAVKELEGLLDESDEISSQAHLLLARIYLESELRDAENPLFFQDKARKHQTKGEGMLPGSAQSYYNRALMAGSVNETLRWLNCAIELQPGYFDALKARGLTYKVLEKHDDLEIDTSVMIGLKSNRP